MRHLYRTELKSAFQCPVEACHPDELAANPGRAIGALVVSAPRPMPDVVPVLPKDRPAIPIIFSDAEEQLEMIRQLREPSVIAVVSISSYFLDIARGVLGPVIGRRRDLYPVGPRAQEDRDPVRPRVPSVIVTQLQLRSRYG